MANIKNQIKRALTNEKRADRNLAERSELKTAIKSVRNASTKEEGTVALSKAYKLLDESVTSNIHHRNYAKREKSRLAKFVNSLEA
ncbi:MAG: 30S ribosomal protein S20 [Erysipelothrix sp.]|nr:30S ribosomal protein S20 [Erysipelothrix sp.]